jgi:hypothetical protein
MAACGPTLRPILTHILPIESLRTILRSKLFQRSSKVAAGEMPSFVQVGSNVDVQSKDVKIVPRLEHRESYELIFRTERCPHV